MIKLNAAVRLLADRGSDISFLDTLKDAFRECGLYMQSTDRQSFTYSVHSPKYSQGKFEASNVPLKIAKMVKAKFITDDNSESAQSKYKFSKGSSYVKCYSKGNTIYLSIK